MNYDLIVIGSGPGGYVAAIRASQLGLKVAVAEKAEIGGICLNWGCIPTKALMKSAQVFNNIKHAADYGIVINGESKPNFEAVIKRSRSVAEAMSKGIQFLFKKNNIEVLKGIAKVKPGKIVEVSDETGSKTEYSASHIIIATGARSKELPGLEQDGEKVIGYRQALTLSKLPESMVVVGSGAIGSEFAYFYTSMGTKVTLVEFMPSIVPVEDDEVSKQLERSFKKLGMKVYTESTVQSVDKTGDKCKVLVKTKKGDEIIEADIVLSAVGVATNIEGIGLEETGIITEKGKVLVDDFYKTNVNGYYAIGDIVKGPALAHVASHEGIICVEKIAGLDVHPLDYSTIPGCTYTHPEISSVGLTEKAALNAGYEIKIGKFPYMASGKATAAGERDGFIKLIFDSKTDKLLGAHMIGYNVTEMIEEAVLAKAFGISGHDLIKTIHPHPTMSEAVMEAAAAAYGEVIHL
jgi:dihydrolipoamide dehydrogenase